MMIKIIILLYISAVVAFFNTAAQETNLVTYTEKYRPQYHLTLPHGALFDPTALVYIDSTYQLNRRLAESSDLIHWKLNSRERLNTDSTREMSGSVVIDKTNSSGFGSLENPPLVAVYSGLRLRDGRQFQCIAYSLDKGKTWTQYDKNPVIDIGSNEFRDPQVFWHAQSGKWIMAVAMAADQKVRFYNSDNLKDWAYTGEFGQVGAVKGVWECPDLFPLPVDGNKKNIKWVLEVSVQPVGVQYFTGEFDGKNFIADKDFLTNLKTLKNKTFQPKGKLLFDFENNLSGWTKEGDAFDISPVTGTLPYQSPVIGFLGNKLINSYYHRDSSKGKLISPSFTIDKKYMNFLIGGGDHPGKTCINLIIDNQLVRTKTGVNTEVLYPACWDVGAFAGKIAHVEIEDDFEGGSGHILIDQITLSDTAAVREREKAEWIDYGPDYYAVRSWVNGPDDRRISLAWMGSWLYASSAPTSPWKGGHTIPRNIELKTFPEGIRLIQNPVDEIQNLREKNINYRNITITDLSPFKLPGISDNSYEMQLEFDITDTSGINVNVCEGINEKTVITYNVKEALLEVDRSQSGQTSFSSSFPMTYKAPLKIRNGKIKLRVLIDHSSIEVFGNNGEAAITCQIYPDPSSTAIDIHSASKNLKLTNLDFWQLKSIWQHD